MQTIKNLNQIKGGAYVLKVESANEQAEIIRLFEEDRRAFLLLYGDNLTLTAADTSTDEIIFV